MYLCCRTYTHTQHIEIFKSFLCFAVVGKKTGKAGKWKLNNFMRWKQKKLRFWFERVVLMFVSFWLDLLVAGGNHQITWISSFCQSNWTSKTRFTIAKGGARGIWVFKGCQTCSKWLFLMPFHILCDYFQILIYGEQVERISSFWVCVCVKLKILPFFSRIITIIIISKQKTHRKAWILERTQTKRLPLARGFFFFCFRLLLYISIHIPLSLSVRPLNSSIHILFLWGFCCSWVCVWVCECGFVILRRQRDLKFYGNFLCE